MNRQGFLYLPEAPIAEQKVNKARWNSTRKKDDAAFFTIGYSGRTADDFIRSLTEAKVACLIDVRFSPVSQFKPEFSKNNLARLLAENEIGYLHRPDLGVPRDVRAKAIETHTRTVIWDWYDEHVASPSFGSNLTLFFNWAEHPVALMCTEHDPTSCHRHRLTLALERHGLMGYDL